MFRKCFQSTIRHTSLRVPAYRPRSFHSSHTPNDIFFCAVPGVKTALVSVTRMGVIGLALAWRYGILSKYPRASCILWAAPIIGISGILLLGVDLKDGRIVILSDAEVRETGDKRLNEVIAKEGGLILPPGDKRVILVHQVFTRLLKVLHQDSYLTLSHQIQIKDTARIQPSAIATPQAQFNFVPADSIDFVKDDKWDIYVIDSPKINASVLPNKSIFIYTGLISAICFDADLLASVLAHEISHLTEQHPFKIHSLLTLTAFTTDIIRSISWALTIPFPYIADLSSIGISALERSIWGWNSKGNELEADARGLMLMAKAGFDPRAAIQALEVLEEEGDLEYESQTHPDVKLRIEKLWEIMPIAMNSYYSAKENNM